MTGVGIGFAGRETGCRGVSRIFRGAFGNVDDADAGSATDADGGPNGFIVGVRSDQQSPRNAYALHIEQRLDADSDGRVVGNTAGSGAVNALSRKSGQKGEHSSFGPSHCPFVPRLAWFRRDGRMRPSLHRLWEFSHPNVAEAQGLAFVAVGLEFDGGAVEFLVERLADVTRLAFQFEVIVDYYSV